MVVRLWQRHSDVLHDSDRDRCLSWNDVCPKCFKCLGKSSIYRRGNSSWLDVACIARMVQQCDGCDDGNTYVASFHARIVQVSARVELDHRRLSVVDRACIGFHRTGDAMGSRCILGTWNRCSNRGPSSGLWRSDARVDVGRTNHWR